MTISEQSSRMIFDGNGVTTAFDFDRPFFDEDELVVAVYDSTVPEIVELDPSAYTVVVTGTFPNNTATITYPLVGSPLTADEQLIIYRMSPQEQSTNISNQSAYFLSSIETRLDQNMLMTQELQDQAHRALKSPLSTPVDIDMVLPVPIDLGVLMWSDTDPYTIIAQPKDEFIIDVSGVENMIDTAIADFAASPEYLAAWQASWDTTTADTVSLDSIEFDQTPAGTPGERVIMWNDEDGTLDIGLAGGNVTLQIGQETLIRVANQTGSLIPDGTPVVYIGANPARIRIAPAIADGTYDPALVLGVTTEDIAHGSEGFVTVRGAIRHINTSGGPVGETWADGDIVYISATTAGALTKVSPQAPDISIPIAVVLYASIGNGQLYIVPPHVKALRDLSDVNGTPLTENGQIIVWDNDNGYFDFTRNAFDYDVAYAALAITHDCSGFSDPGNVVQTYDSATRTCTITSLGTGSAYFDGHEVPLTLPWTSDPHDNINGRYFLQYDGNDFIWDTTINFPNMLIMWVNFGATDKFAIRECHGLMDWESHREFHTNIGTYRTTGGTLSNYTLNSTTDKYPYVSATTLYDEDLPTINPALSVTNDYTQAYRSGSGETVTFVKAQSSWIPVSGNQPYYNQYTGGSWVQTLMPLGYMSVWLVAIPTTTDTESQAYRYIWIQGQSVSANSTAGLAEQRALTFSGINIGELSTIASEFVAINQIILRYNAANWSITEIKSILGSKNFQASIPALDWVLVSSIDDTPVDGATTAPISSNWAYDHENAVTAHAGAANLVHIGGTETITGAKTFTANILLDAATSANFSLNCGSVSNLNRIYFNVAGTNAGLISYNPDAVLANDTLTFYVGGISNSVLTLGASSLTTPFRIISTLATGTSPFSVTSTTLNTNLNSDLLDGQHGSYYATDSLAMHIAGVETVTGVKSFTGNNYWKQGSTGNIVASATLTAAQVDFRVLRVTTSSATITLTMPLEADMASFFVDMADATYFDINIINLGSTYDVILDKNDWDNSYGPLTIKPNTAALFRIRKVSGTSWFLYSLSNWSGNADTLDGQHGSYYAPLYMAQGAPTSKTTSTTLTAAELATRIIKVNNGAAGTTTLTLPTAANTDTQFSTLATGYAFEFTVINNSTVAAEDATIATNTGWTLDGNMVIESNDSDRARSSGTFRARKTGTAAYTLFRIS